jgi:hypothetical protein
MSERSNPTTRWWGGCALAGAGLLLWSNGPISTFYAGVPAVAALALLIVARMRPALLDRYLPRRTAAWRIEAALVVIFSAACLRIAFHLGFLVVMAGVALLATEARRGGEAHHLDPLAAWSGGWARRILLLAVVLAAFNFSSDFAGEFNTSFYSEATGGYSVHDPASDGYDTGDAPKIAVLLLPAFLWLSWRTTEVPKWYRYVPLASLGAAALWTFKIAWDDYAFVQELYEIGGSYSRFQAAGPTWFLLLMIPAIAIAVLFAVKGVAPQPPLDRPATAT